MDSLLFPAVSPTTRGSHVLKVREGSSCPQLAISPEPPLPTVASNELFNGTLRCWSDSIGGAVFLTESSDPPHSL